MNREEAKQALADGKRLTHTYFTKDEWVEKLNGYEYIYEDGVTHNKKDFWRMREFKDWDEGWSEYEKN